jgi:hypothetical protein
LVSLRITQLWLLAMLILFFSPVSVLAQETVFNVPSADVLEKGKAYAELDSTVRPVDPMVGFTPRFVVGTGYGIEVGMNFAGWTSPTPGELEIVPTIKWKIWKGKASGWTFFIGDNLFFPVARRTFNAGNYSYAAFAKEWKHGTRVSFGGYDFTRNVVADANRAGGQFSIEQQLNKRVGLAADWYTGKQSVGYVSPGAVIKLTSKLTLFAAYQIGNSGLTSGNHQFLWELGYNFN